ncbi:hypothetical protein FMUND_14501 [Fusarium mundagurra]|uniref:Uncharacterized protein n=1 Tax=Fusarium mundagurra TaxID=1567541 RepID=A0A8H5XU06_9HYPO|nr:hypothetical protein FMUND_14501 [Fusarium mundagurra]
MSEENPQANNPSENFATGNAPQALDSNAATGMAVYEPKPEPQNEPNDFSPEFVAEDAPQFFRQDVPENVQVNDHSGPGNGKSREHIPREQVYGNSIRPEDELGSHTGRRVRFDENLPSRRSREKESRRRGSHEGGSHRGESHRSESHRREPRRTDDRETKSHKKESHHSKTSESHRSSSNKKDSHRSGSDRKGSHRSESRRSDSNKRDSRKSSKKEDSHKKKTIDAIPEYGRISFRKTVTHYVHQTAYIRTPVQIKKRGD